MSLRYNDIIMIEKILKEIESLDMKFRDEKKTGSFTIQFNYCEGGLSSINETLFETQKGGVKHNAVQK